MGQSAWQGDWAARIQRYVREHGFASATDFVAHHPTLSMLALASMLGGDVAAVQLERILYTEAGQRGTFHWLVRDWLVRRLHECMPNGWSVEPEDKFAYTRSLAYARWISSLDEAHRSAGEEAWDRLKKQDIPAGWLPRGPDDSIIERAFAGVRIDPPETED